MSIYGFQHMDRADVPTPATGEYFEFIDIANGHKTRKLSNGTFIDLDAAGSIPGADGITFTPSGDITSTNVQDAIEELDAEKAPQSHVGSTGVSEHGVATGVVAGFMSPTDKSKLDGISSGATANDTDANLKNRANHTGTQTASTISDFSSAAKSAVVDDAIADGVVDKAPSQNAVFDALALVEKLANKGVANGYAPLNGATKIPSSYLEQAIKDQLHLLGTWDASANSPTLTSGSGEKGGFYIVAVAGTTNLDGENDWNPKDWAFFDGSVWKKIDNTDQVTIVNGQQGAVNLDTDDIPEGATNLYHTVSRSRTAAVLNSLAGTETDQAPSVSATNAGLATKLTDLLTTIGDMFYRDGSNVTARFGIGAENSILRVVSGLPSWEEENLMQDIGDGSDGNATISGALTAPDILYYDNLTLDLLASLNPDAYMLYAKRLDLTNAPANAISRNGNNGTNVSANTGGAGGAAFTARALATNGAGGTGAAGQTNAGVQGAAGGAVTIGNGGNGGASGQSGAGGTGAAANAIAGGAVTTNIHFGRFEYQFTRGVTSVSGGAGGRGGNSGGGDGANSSRGAGGGGAGGAVLVLYVGEIITGPSTPAGVIASRGGIGGKQNNPPAAGNVGGASGAGGGGGGYIYIAYVKKTGPVVNNLIDASGGLGGDGSPGLGTGIGGNGGQGGNGGRIQLFNVTTGVGTLIVGAAGSLGTAGVGTVPGVGGQGGSCKASL